MEFGKGEINRRKQSEFNDSMAKTILENARRMVEWKDETYPSSNSKNEELSSRKIVSEAWNESIKDHFGNYGVQYIEKYIAENYQLIVDDIKANKPCFHLSNISEVATKLNIKDLLQTVIYFYMWKYNLAMTVLGYIGEITDTAILSALSSGNVNIAKEISGFYKDVITPDYIKNYYEGKDIPKVEEFIAEMTEITEEAIVSACYLSSKLILGVGEVVEDAIDYAIAGLSSLVGKKEIANAVYSRSFTRELAKEIENSFNGNEQIRDAGRVAEKIGSIGTYVGLSMVATSASVLGTVPVVAAVGANVFLGLAKASDITRKTAEISGEVDSKELLCGLGAGILTVVCTQTTSWLNGKINTVFSEAIKEIQQSGTDMVGAKILLKGLEDAAIEGAVGGAIFSLQDVYEDILMSVVDKENNISWKEIFSDVGIDVAEGAALGILFYSVGVVVKDVTAMKNYEGDLSWKERIQIKLETGWDNSIIKCIKNMEQYDVYKNANLHQEEIFGRLCLCKEIDMDYVTPKTIDDRNPNGLTNRELLQNGRVPYDSKTGERIELHHMGQSYDSPFAELLENSEHGDGKDAILHDKGLESWRRDPQLKNAYNNIDRPGHWQERAEIA